MEVEEEDYTESEVSLEGKFPSCEVNPSFFLLLFGSPSDCTSALEIENTDAGPIRIGWLDEAAGLIQSILFYQPTRLLLERFAFDPYLCRSIRSLEYSYS
jgi:hypothetical protein